MSKIGKTVSTDGHGNNDEEDVDNYQIPHRGTERGHEKLPFGKCGLGKTGFEPWFENKDN